MRLFKIGFFACVLSALAAKAGADQQIITVDPVAPAFGESDSSVTISVVYSTDPANTAATGLGVTMFFNSSLLSGDGLAVNDELGGQRTGPALSDDSNDDDNDPSTDKKLIVAWIENTESSGFGGSESVPWPEVDDFSDGVKLMDVTFGRADPDFTGTTTVNFAVDTAAGFDASAESVDIIFKDDETPPELSLAESTLTISPGP